MIVLVWMRVNVSERRVVRRIVMMNVLVRLRVMDIHVS